MAYLYQLTAIIFILPDGTIALITHQLQPANQLFVFD